MKVIALDKNATVSGLLRDAAKKYPDNTAMISSIRRITYAQLDYEVDLAARRLLSLGIKHGEHVGVWCENEINEVVIQYAIARIGGVAALFNTNLQDEMLSLVKRSEIRFIFVGPGSRRVDFPKACLNVLHQYEKLKDFYYISDKPYEGKHKMFKDLPLASEDELKSAEALVKPEDCSHILFTSGTTSAPKLVMCSNYSRANIAIQQAKDMGATEKDIFCAVLPSFHCFALAVNTMASCAVGATMVIPENRRTKTILETIQKYKCTILHCVPTLFHAVMSRPDFKEWDISSLRTGFIGGSMCSEKLFRDINNNFGMTLLSSLGQTEANAGLTTANLDDSLDVRATTVGHFMDHVEGKIIDIQSGEEIKDGRAGEICIRGYNLMMGYYGQPEKTAETIDADGWLHTGDMGYLDEAKNLHLTGRIKDLIIRGGENISPSEIEDVVTDDGRISEARAIGVPDDHYGEVVCLCVVEKTKGQFPEAEIRKLLADKLAEYKVPQYILFMDDLPKTATGKVDSRKISAAALEIIKNK